MLYIYPALKTISAINEAIEKDQGNEYRRLLKKYIPLARDVYEQSNGGLRGYLGASVLGETCARKIWYGFNWYLNSRFDGRMLRLFNRGHLEEPRMLALLELIGCEIYTRDTHGNNFTVTDCDGYFGGTCDGVIVGIPDLPHGEACVAEFKTHNAKSFADLIKHGARGSKPSHYTQGNLYGFKLKVKSVLYMAVNKDTDEIYAEIIPINPEHARECLDKAVRIISSKVPPARISETSSYYICKFCDFSKICHSNQKPIKNCRTCTQREVVGNGQWGCRKHNTKLTVEAQKIGCDQYEVNA